MQPFQQDLSSQWTKASKEVLFTLEKMKKDGTAQISELQEKMKACAKVISGQIPSQNQQKIDEIITKLKEGNAVDVTKCQQEVIGLVHDIGKLMVQKKCEEAIAEATNEPTSYNEIIKKYELHGKEYEPVRVKLAILFVKADLVDWSIDLDEFDIVDPKAYLEILKTTAECNTYHFLKNLGRFKWDVINEKSKFEMMQIAATRHSELTADNIEKVNITNEQHLASISLLVAKDYFANAESPDELEPLIKLLKKINPTRTLPEYISSNASIKIQVDKIKDPATKSKVDAVLRYFDCCATASNLNTQGKEKLLPFLGQILAFEEPRMRFALVDFLAKKEAPVQKSPVSALLFHMLLNPLQAEAGLSDKDWMNIKTSLDSKIMEDSGKKEIVLKGLYNLVENQGLSNLEKGILLKRIFCPKLPITSEVTQKVAVQLQMLGAILQFGNVANLKKALTPTQNESQEKIKEGSASSFKDVLTTLLCKMFQQSLGITQLDDFQQKYDKYLASARQPNALLIYAGRLQTLASDSERTATLASLKAFTLAVLDNSYEKLRYATPQGSHLEKVFQSREQEGLKKAWQGGKTSSVENLVPFADSSSKTIVNSLLAAARPFIDGKTYSELAKLSDKYPTADACHKAKVELNDWFKNNKPLQGAKFNPADANSRFFFQNKLELALVSLLGSGAPSEQTKSFNEAVALLRKNCIPQEDETFSQGVAILQNNLRLASVKKLSVEDTDNWQDMLLIGTEVPTCQRISGDVRKNLCLVGYLSDGKNRAIVVKEEGKIIARCIIRLLWDDIKKCPVMCQESLYSKEGVAPECMRAIEEMAKERAKELGLTLVRYNDDENAHRAGDYPNDVQSTGSPGPFEYVDMGHKGVTNGNFTLTKGFLITAYTPPAPVDRAAAA